MAKKKADNGHRMGQRCGYTVKEDGRIIPAPTYNQQFEKLASERHGINDLMKLFSSHCADLLAEISRRQSHLWDSICEDYGINRDTHSLSWDGYALTVTPRPPPEPPKQSAVSGEPQG